MYQFSDGLKDSDARNNREEGKLLRKAVKAALYKYMGGQANPVSMERIIRTIGSMAECSTPSVKQYVGQMTSENDEEPWCITEYDGAPCVWWKPHHLPHPPPPTPAPQPDPSPPTPPRPKSNRRQSAPKNDTEEA